jgi:hypothetical protein
MMVATNKALGRLSKRPDEPSPGADVGRTSPVPVQTWDGRAQSRCRCGRGMPGPGSDTGGVSPVSVQTWEGHLSCQSTGQSRRCPVAWGNECGACLFVCYVRLFVCLRVPGVPVAGGLAPPRAGSVPRVEGRAGGAAALHKRRKARRVPSLSQSLSLLRVVSEWPRNPAHTAARSCRRRRRCREGNRHSHLLTPTCALRLAHSYLRTPTCGAPACQPPPPPPCAAKASIAASWLVAAQWWAAFLAQGDARKVYTVGLSHRQSHVRVCFDGFWPPPPPPPPPPRMQSRARARPAAGKSPASPRAPRGKHNGACRRL